MAIAEALFACRFQFVALATLVSLYPPFLKRSNFQNTSLDAVPLLRMIAVLPGDLESAFASCRTARYASGLDAIERRTYVSFSVGKICQCCECDELFVIWKWIGRRRVQSDQRHLSVDGDSDLVPVIDVELCHDARNAVLC
jgi:hypothetical protein